MRPTPNVGISTAISARLGIARPTLETLIARIEPRWWWPSQTPSGSAITAAIASASADTPSWNSVRLTSSDRWSPMNVNTVAVIAVAAPTA